MARECEITGKRTILGNSVPRKGLSKRKGGGGQHIVSRTKRTFKVNLVNKKFFIPELGRTISMRISTNALKSISKVGLETFLKKNCRKIEDFI